MHIIYVTFAESSDSFRSGGVVDRLPVVGGRVPVPARQLPARAERRHAVDCGDMPGSGHVDGGARVCC